MKLLVTIEIAKIITPMLILLAVAAVFAVLLAFLSKVLNVERDGKIDEVRACLPGSNCGGCGSSGCDNFAEKLVAKEVKLGDCAQITKENITKINEILSLNEGGLIETVAVVRCSGGIQCKDKYEYLGYGNCRSLELMNNGNKECPSGCMGFGDCVATCNYNSICVNDKNFAKTDVKKCISCGLCIKACPKKLIERVPKSATVYLACKNCNKGKDVSSICTAGCISCGICAKACDAGAITMINNLPVIDYYKCTGCMKCYEKCPKKVIKILNN